MPEPGGGTFPSGHTFPGLEGAIGPFTAGIIASHEPWLEQDTTGSLYNWLIGIGSMFDLVTSLVMDQGSPDEPGFSAGWSTLLDPTACPAQFLPFCGMFAGVNVPPGTAPATARAMIHARAEFSRGTAQAIVMAAQLNLTGTQSVTLLERTSPGGPDPYHAILVMSPEQVTNLAVLQAAVELVKPAGIQLSYVLSDLWKIFQMESAYATISALEAAFTTITGLESDEVGH